jgi:hypothetical protein
MLSFSPFHLKWSEWRPQCVKTVTCIAAGLKDVPCWGLTWLGHTWLMGLSEENITAIKKVIMEDTNASQS